LELFRQCGIFCFSFYKYLTTITGPSFPSLWNNAVMKVCSTYEEYANPHITQRAMLL
jgi:hypothetical protein